MIFLGPLFEREQEKEILRKSKVSISNAGNTFQWNVIDGLCENLPQGFRMINVLPVGTWGKYDAWKLPDRTWNYRNVKCTEVGCVNLPVIKQWMRANRTAKFLKNTEEDEIVICTAYLPFLKAAYRLPREKKVTVIVTDIPEYYDMRQVSNIRKLLRRMNNHFVYKYLERVDRFVLLTDQMKEPLHVGTRPYIVMEGICADEVNTAQTERENSVLYSGRLNYRYGIETLLKAFAQIEDESARLWICGSGEMEEDIRNAARRDRRIEFMGFKTHAEVLALQKRAKVLVNPRTNSGEYTKYSFPSKTMEYMVSGTPVVMYHLDGVPEEYFNHVICVHDDSVDSLKNSILKALYMSERERNTWGKEAEEFVLQNKNAMTQTGRILKFIGVT